MIGVISWSNRLDSVTMRAAVFCIDLNLFNRCLVRPYNKELQISSLELINACTKISEVSSKPEKNSGLAFWHSPSAVQIYEISYIHRYF